MEKPDSTHSEAEERHIDNSEASGITNHDIVLENMLSSTENYRKAVEKWCRKATYEDYQKWDDECRTVTASCGERIV